MLQIIAQATQPSNRWSPESIISVLTALLALITALKSMLGASSANAKSEAANDKSDTNQQNIQALGSSLLGAAKAINKTPGGYNANDEVIRAAKEISIDPSIAVSPPSSTDPHPSPPPGIVRT